MSFARATGYCFLDAFRPGPRQRLEWAVFSTYSLDLVALVALLMELADVEGEGLDAGDVPFIQAIEKLTGKVAVLCQHGRISFPKSSAHRILILLDRFLRKVPYDEREQSWHAKIGLAKYARVDAATVPEASAEWRLWLGSRNLTQNPDWEAGIVLVGRPARGRERPSDVPGLRVALDALLMRVWGKPGQVRAEMAAMNQVAWRAPPGVTVETIAFRQGSGGPVLLAPPAGVRFRSITAAAPFVDVGGLNKIAGLPLIGRNAVGRTIVTTRTQLSRPSLVKSASATGVTLRLMTPPSEDGTTTLSDLPPSEIDKTAASSSSPAGEGIEGNALASEEEFHAKLVLARGVRKGANTLWIGSANLTGRGLEGRNAEIVARLRVPEEVADSLEKFFSSARRFIPEKDSIEETDADRAKRKLNEQRNALVAGVFFKLVTEGKSIKLVADRAPLDGKPGYALVVALLSTPRNSWSWPNAATEAVLAEDLPKMHWTDMIAFELRGPTGEKVCWIQQVEAEGFDSTARRARDDAAIVDYLGHERAVLWIHAAVTGKPGDSERTWDGRERPFGRATHKRPGLFGLTLESMLAGWARDPEALSNDTRHAISARIEILRRSLESNMAIPDKKRAKDLKDLERFNAAWCVLLRAAGKAGR